MSRRQQSSPPSEKAFSVDPFAALCSDGLPAGPAAAEIPEDRAPAHDVIRVRLEKKGRGGRQVTVLYGFETTPVEALPDLARHLRQTLGTGGTVAGDTVELQGDCRARAADYLRAAGHRVKGA